MHALQGFLCFCVSLHFLAAGADRTDPPLDVLFGPDHGGLAAHAATADADLLLGFAAGTVTQVGRGAAEARPQPVEVCGCCEAAHVLSIPTRSSWQAGVGGGCFAEARLGGVSTPQTC